MSFSVRTWWSVLEGIFISALFSFMHLNKLTPYKVLLSTVFRMAPRLHIFSAILQQLKCLPHLLPAIRRKATASNQRDRLSVTQKSKPDSEIIKSFYCIQPPLNPVGEGMVSCQRKSDTGGSLPNTLRLFTKLRAHYYHLKRNDILKFCLSFHLLWNCSFCVSHWLSTYAITIS